MSHHGDVRPGSFAQLGDLIHEADPRRQHRVGRVLGQLGRRDVHEDQRVAGSHEWLVELLEYRPHPIVLDPTHDSIGTHEVVNRRAFLQELRVGADVEGTIRVFLDLSSHPTRGADRHGTLRDHDRALGHALPDDACYVQDVLKIGRPILVRRGADGDEYDLALEHCRPDVRREAEALLGHIS